MHASVTERLTRLQADQRAAATAAPGPVLCVAPAGSGKTTTLVARIAWLVDGGVDPESICAITFNRRAAEELRERIEAALAPLGEGLPARIRIRTFHALGLDQLMRWSEFAAAARELASWATKGSSSKLPRGTARSSGKPSLIAQ